MTSLAHPIMQFKMTKYPFHRISGLTLLGIGTFLLFGQRGITPCSIMNIIVYRWFMLGKIVVMGLAFIRTVSVNSRFIPVLVMAKQENPARWNGRAVRNCSPVPPTALNPVRPSRRVNANEVLVA